MEKNNSSSKKWLIIGGSGLLGKNLIEFLLEKGESVLGTYNSHSLESKNYCYLNLFDNPLNKLEEKSFEPDVIVNTVALTNVDQCETDHALAEKLNINSVSQCIEIQNHFNSSNLVHISTDQIHNGKYGNFNEKDQPSPINQYGKTKLLGEEIALNSTNALVCRSNFYGPGLEWRSSFSDWILSNLEQKKEIPLFTDSIFNPLSARQLSQNIYDLVDQKLTGLFHTCGNENLSKYEFATKLSNHFGLDSSLLIPTKLSDLKLKALRPLNMTLNIDKMEKALGRPAGYLTDGFNSLTLN